MVDQSTTTTLSSLGGAFAISVATQQALELVDPLVDWLSKYLARKAKGTLFANTDIKRAILGFLTLGPGTLAYVCGITLLHDFMAFAGAINPHPNSFLEWFVTALVIGAGSDAFNSIMKFINAVKEERQGAAEESFEKVTTKNLENQAFQLATFTPRGRPRPLGSTCHVLAIGDSIVWGQGLEEKDKFTQRLRERIEKVLQRETKLHPLARSGATIEDHKDDKRLAYSYQDLPSSRPTIIDQALNFTEVASDEVSVVIMDGGINDINTSELLTVSSNELRSRTNDYCYFAMRKLLQQVSRRYRNADIVVTGYYPLISKSSQNVTMKMLQVLSSFSVTSTPVATGLVVPIDAVIDWISGGPGHMVENSLAFADIANKCLARAVEEINDNLFSDGGDRRIMFIDPKFSADNAFCAPNSFLWELGVPPTYAPQDTFANRRMDEAKKEKIHNLYDEFFAYRASAFHPNPKGANRYFERIEPELIARLLARKDALNAERIIRV